MPDSFRFEGLEAFEQALKTFAPKAERGVSEWVRNYAYALSYSLVMETPQYSGAAASAWRVGIGAPVYITEKPDFSFVRPGKGVESLAPFSKKDPNMRAVAEALAACNASIGMYSLLMGSMYLSNGLPYTGWFETGEHAPGQALRTENLPQRKVADSMRASLVTMTTGT